MRADLKRYRKEEKIVQDILDAVRQGALTPGDRLASYTELRHRYKTAQRTIESAIATLRRRGIVESIPRSGTYICETVDAEALAPPTEAEADEQDLQFLDLMAPRPTRRQTLSLHISEVHPRMLALWREILDDFSHATVTLTTGRDGRAEELFGSHQFDLVQATPLILETIGAEHFVPLDRVGLLGDAWHADLLPMVRARLESDEPVHGVPCMVTLRYLFVNLDLLEQVGSRIEEIPDTAEGLMRLAARLQPAARKAGADALIIGLADNFLWLHGALRWEDGRLEVDPERARSFFSVVAEGTLPLARINMETTAFAEGRLLFLPHCSYETVGFSERRQLRWRALPAPTAGLPPLPCWLTVLGVNRDSAQPELAIELVRYLVSPEVQRRFAGQHGNLPVLATPGHATATTDGGIRGADLPRAIERSSLLCPLSRFVRISQSCGLHHELRQLQNGSATVDELVERFRCVAAFFHDHPTP